jgi:hypothetical protein
VSLKIVNWNGYTEQATGFTYGAVRFGVVLMTRVTAVTAVARYGQLQHYSHKRSRLQSSLSKVACIAVTIEGCKYSTESWMRCFDMFPAHMGAPAPHALNGLGPAARGFQPWWHDRTEAAINSRSMCNPRQACYTRQSARWAAQASLYRHVGFQSNTPSPTQQT